MALAMSRPFKHPKTGMFWLRKRVPDDLRKLVGKREELKSLQTRDPDEAKRRFVIALAEVEAKWVNLRQGNRTLSEREAHELAIAVHDHWIATYRDNPGEQTFWRTKLMPKLWNISPWPDSDPPELSNVAAIMTQSWCTERAQQILTEHGLRVDAAGELKLGKAVAAAMQRASLTLARFAEGEYDASPAAAPRAVKVEAPVAKPVSFDTLVEGWAAEKRPAEKTVYEWRRVTKRLAVFLGFDDAAQVTTDDLLRWKAEMVGAGRRPKTIRDAQLAPIRALMRWAVDNRLLPANPAERVTIDVKLRPGEAIRSFTDEEAALILRAASASHDPVRRWVTWLCAYSGARVSEVCQLRKEDVVCIDTVWAMKFDPKAGSLKTLSSERTVPLHPAVLSRGFLEFVQSADVGPLFPALPPDKFGKRGGNGTKVLGRWVRSLGVVDTRLAPNHSWRHRLKTSGRRYGLAPDIIDAITGHAHRSVGDRYGEFPISALHRELMKIPDLLTTATPTATATATATAQDPGSAA